MRRILHPEHVTPSQLDDFLGQGWYRIGDTLMTCRATWIGEALRSTVWTRVPVADHTFPKSSRRIMRRVESRFRIEVGPLVLDAERVALYQRYRALAPASRCESLRQFLGDRPGLFDTHEIRVWDGNALAAFSWFDLGATSVQSLLGVYDPVHRAQSLGVYTMLRELQFARDSGRRFFYAGYILPGNPAMDYKLRTGNVWFLDDGTATWRPWSDYVTYTPAVARMDQALDKAAAALAGRRIQATRLSYRWFDLPADAPGLTTCLDLPLALACAPESVSRQLLVVWCPATNAYRVLDCTGVVPIANGRRLPDVQLWRVDQTHFAGTDLEALGTAVERAA